MSLPFTKVQFFDVFAAYNTAVWPAQFLLVALAIALVVVALRAPANAGRIVSSGLALLWTWLALAYHLAFFWPVNPAAPFFAAIALATAAAFAWVGGVRNRLRFERGLSGRVALGLAVVAFALAVYPTIGKMAGHSYPASVTFGLPCPTTIFTFGLLLMAANSLPKALVLGPLVWAVIGSFAAFALGVPQDLALVAVALIGIYLLLRPGARSTMA